VSARIEFASYVNTDVDYAARTLSDGLNTESVGNGDGFIDAVKGFADFCDARHIGGMGYSLSSPPPRAVHRGMCSSAIRKSE
jgi:hypothetical protein